MTPSTYARQRAVARDPCESKQRQPPVARHHRGPKGRQRAVARNAHAPTRQQRAVARHHRPTPPPLRASSAIDGRATEPLRHCPTRAGRDAGSALSTSKAARAHDETSSLHHDTSSLRDIIARSRRARVTRRAADLAPSLPFDQPQTGADLVRASPHRFDAAPRFFSAIPRRPTITSSPAPDLESRSSVNYCQKLSAHISHTLAIPRSMAVEC